MAYARGGSWYLCPFNRTTAGFWKTGEPVLAISAGDAQRLGEAVQSCLAESSPAMEFDRARRNDLPEVAARAGAATWSKFVRSAREFSIDADGERIDITQKSDRGREVSRTIALREPAALDIGQALITMGES